MPGREPEGRIDKPSDYMPYGASGGGGQGGGYVFADLAELNAMITKWESVRERIATNNDKIRGAIGVVKPPAHDDPSGRQAKAYIDSLVEAQQHNQAMLDYAKGYIDKLRASRTQYAANDQAAADRQRNVYEA